MTFCYLFTVPAGNLVLSQEDLNLIEVFNEVALPVPSETFGNEDIEANKKKILAKRQLPELEKPVGKGPFPCKECPAAFGSIFNTWGKYKKHMKSHQDDRRYSCKECPQTFNLEKNLRLHFATHDPIDLVCPECNK